METMDCFVAALLAMTPRFVCSLEHAPSTMLRMVPLPHVER
jgi:hypothetical protein